MTRGADEVADVLALAASGLNQCEISRRTGIPRTTLGQWIRGKVPQRSERRFDCSTNGSCSMRHDVPEPEYAYLLGLYLGDGCINEEPRKVFRLRITCCDDYPELMAACERAMAAVMPTNKVGRVQREGCTDVFSYSKHWICLFPQHGAGRKHERPIELEPWQVAIVQEYPKLFLAGLVHSDGCRCINRVRRKVGGQDKWYEYPRYFFTNESGDIRMLFGDACDVLGIEWRHNNRKSISVARRDSVAILESFIGPKR